MITTKKGDKGQSHFLGMVIDKDSPLLEVIGSIDELQANLEFINGEEMVVDDLNQLMGVISCGSEVDILKKVNYLEKEIDKLEKKLPKMTKFLRFKGEKALKLNLARTICRRVERRVVVLDKNKKLDGEILQYFNRLSDYLFVRARQFNKN
jgi:cob(I)alamin adenosyltransferase